MRLYRPRKSDSTQAAIVRELSKLGYLVSVIREPVDLQIGRESWGNRFVLLECKPLTGKRKPKARIRKDQPEQNEFCARYRVPRVTSWIEAHAAVLDLTRGWDQ